MNIRIISVTEDKFHVLLVNPPPVSSWDYTKKFYYSPPIGVLSVGTVLKINGFSVKIIDGAYEENYLKTIEDIVRYNKLYFVGISAMTAQLPAALKVAALVRWINSAIPLVWGGVHPSLFPEQTLRHELVDVVVRGEGEYTCLEFATLARKGDGCRHIPGTFCKEGDRLIENPARGFAELEKLPFFDFSLLNIEDYILKDRTDVGGKNLRDGPKRRSLPILSGLGCPYHCAFCIESIMKKKYRTRSAESLISEVERLKGKYNANDISFIDDLFFADRKRLMRFLDLLEEHRLNISWGANVRANYFNEKYLNLNLLKRIRYLGCYHLGLGAESGSERILRKIDKQINKQQVINAAKWCKQTNINVGFSFMIGLPGETKEEMKETVKFAFDLIEENPKNSNIIGPNVFRPYPTSKLFEECVEEFNFQTPRSLQDWSKVYSHEEGYFRLENLPWIKDPRFIRILVFYLFRGTTNFVYPVLWMRFLFGVLKKICRQRLRLIFFFFPIEYEIFAALRVVIFKIKRRRVKKRSVAK